MMKRWSFLMRTLPSLGLCVCLSILSTLDISSHKWSVLIWHTVKHFILQILGNLVLWEKLWATYLSPQLFRLRINISHLKFGAWVSMTSQARRPVLTEDPITNVSTCPWAKLMQKASLPLSSPLPCKGVEGFALRREEERGEDGRGRVVMGTDMVSPVWVRRLETKWQNSETMRGCTVRNIVKKETNTTCQLCGHFFVIFRQVVASVK